MATCITAGIKRGTLSCQRRSLGFVGVVRSSPTTRKGSDYTTHIRRGVGSKGVAVENRKCAERTIREGVAETDTTGLLRLMPLKLLICQCLSLQLQGYEVSYVLLVIMCVQGKLDGAIEKRVGGLADGGRTDLG